MNNNDNEHASVCAKQSQICCMFVIDTITKLHNPIKPNKSKLVCCAINTVIHPLLL